MNKARITALRAQILAHYREYGRHDLPWRMSEADGSFDPYKILVSEMMLQQTQVPRVVPKYAAFLRQFPTIAILADAPLGSVLAAWQGLGYNRRAKFLWQAARTIAQDLGGTVPESAEELTKLPGVGENTAGAILAYTLNEPAIFVETNIRTVLIHHFFADRTDISDNELKPLLTKALDTHNPRQFYWALMDYGSYLKQTVGNLSRASKGYAKQSKFTGSRRQLRGRIVRSLLAGPMKRMTLLEQLSDIRTDDVVKELEIEGLIRGHRDSYELP